MGAHVNLLQEVKPVMDTAVVMECGESDAVLRFPA